jgi:hypothetical protein
MEHTCPHGKWEQHSKLHLKLRVIRRSIRERALGAKFGASFLSLMMAAAPAFSQNVSVDSKLITRRRKLRSSM